MPFRSALLLLPLLLALSACATTSAPASSADLVRPPEARELDLSLHLIRSSAEHRAVFLQTCRLAEMQLGRLTEGRERRSWAVILDADETVLDNSEYQKRSQDLRGGPASDLARVGVSWIVLPNPMYGSWQRNQVR